MADRNAPIEGKVWSSANGGTAGAAAATFILWLLGVLVWGADWHADHALDAVTAVPGPVAGIVALGLVYGGAMVSGWFTKHTPRPAPVGDDAGAVVDKMERENRQLREALAAYANGAVEPPDLEPAPAAGVVDADGDGHDDKNGQFVAGAA